MRRTSLPDRLTVIAIAVVAYALMNVCHELIGHCGVSAVVGARCTQLSSTDIRLAKDITEIPARTYNVILVAGSAANWALGLACFGLLRRWQAAGPGLRYFLWLSMCVNLFLPSGYMTGAAVIRYGDAYFLISNLPGQLFWRAAVVLAGAALCWLSFRLSLKELRRLTGSGGRGARSVAWELVAPAYVAGGIITVVSALFSDLEFKWAQLQAAGGTFGLTALLLLLPLGISEAASSERHPFALPRSTVWIVAGALAGLVFVGVLGPGIAV